MAYARDVTQLDRDSLNRYWAYLKHLLLWADEVFFGRVMDKRPTFAMYLISDREASGLPAFAPVTLRKIFQTAKRFFLWAKTTYPREFQAMPMAWIDALRLPRTTQVTQDHIFVTLDEVKQLVALSVDENDLATRRDQAAVAMLFLSGMRAGAFGSLTLECVDLTSRTIKQSLSLGVKTKNSKTATTYLLNIPELLAVVSKWDTFIRERLPITAPWYAPIISQWGEQTLSANQPGSNRNIALAKRFRKLFTEAGLPYRSPHKFRHGHAVFALQHANTMADYKAVSMNLMHSDIRVTDGIYAPLARDEVKERIIGQTSTQVQLAVDEKNTQIINRLSDVELSELLVEAAQRLKG
ncbi:MAG: tyrosine-type recombinase/integrase [Chloroflexi bacterium]|nr:tyrosine-type recombinase/integrase [Chloroflexota bacterium]